MLTLEGIFDGHVIECLEHVPFTQKKRVFITFLEETLSEPERAADLDPISALRGRDRQAHLTEKLLMARKEDLAHEASAHLLCRCLDCGNRKISSGDSGA